MIGKNIHYIARLIYWSSSRSFVFNLSSVSPLFACLRRHANRFLAPSLARTIHLRQVPRVTTIISRDVSYCYVLARIRPRISVYQRVRVGTLFRYACVSACEYLVFLFVSRCILILVSAKCEGAVAARGCGNHDQRSRSRRTIAFQGEG